MRNALRLIRVYHDLTQTQVAAKVGLSKSYVSELEKGDKKITLEVLEKYARGFDIPLSSLMLFAENTEDNPFVEKVRRGVADKVLKMLDWVDMISREKQEAN